MTRATIDETWIAVANDVAKRSLCVRDQVGAVIISEHGRIVSTGYNGPARGFPIPYPMTEEGPWDHLPCNHWCDRGLNGPTKLTGQSYTDCPSLHAEANALSVCDRSVRERGTIYVTSSICFNCAKLIANSGLRRVVVAINADTYAVHRLSENSIALLIKCGISVDTVDTA